MATKAFKNEKIQELSDSIAKSKVAIVTDYRGLTVAEITDLRRQLQKEGAEYTVVKNTLTKIAIKDTPYDGLENFLEGPSAVVFGFQDQVAPAKILTQFIKKAKKVDLKLKGGVLEGKILSPEEIRQLSELPSKEELYAKILGSVNSPASGLVNVINGVARALVIAMEEVRKQKEAQQ
ncbi:MAG: 50S ribosomal protein L10 [Candidatus Melainabacteria bacterium RIFOXYA12_FULL_32_12]|nr:MAG: 50S ribosomal protein L10 [Candidatus Melainabacteria bacterium GWF2_32_7]OGI23126.1 MAG: 50S ribosomal protein L10 [Candidatus Melainabacteria bacterium RIFOXYA2_FULL_32_9]OGI30338.1 MAG: 50S ribosomal protein L10 [Candidatus Melainabacteria bacterium RIFOXYA12_FULL_32_12]